MKVTTKELRIHPGKIISQVSVGEEITVTYRGKPLAKIIPFQPVMNNEEETSIFGMWKDDDNAQSVEELVRNFRKGRQFR
ncbi:MAG: type II toxin-antitoxin system prevent-host-death family antitoxin [Spirochaetia bacterium]|nr:type II toxin-antitoxin system prevent-host-death family antitoxin [Spirochaetia bacterium]